MVASSTTGSGTDREPERSLASFEKGWLASLVLYDFLMVRVGLQRSELPRLIDHLGQSPRLRIRPLRPRRLGRIVNRVLRLGPYRPRCLVLSLVHFRLLRRQGTAAEIVLGLPPDAESHQAHAWVEVQGVDVGPPPGRMGHGEMARYGR